MPLDAMQEFTAPCDSTEFKPLSKRKIYEESEDEPNALSE
jgi:hypothetical protein